MGLAGFRGGQWTGILLSASLLTIWNAPAAAQSTQHTGLSFYSTQGEKASLDKPILSVNPSTVSEQKDMVTFYCNTTADNATIHWISKNLYLVLNERMLLSANHQTLTILTVHREDAGSYQCEVQLGLESKSSDATMLYVNYGPDPVTIKLDSGVASGDTVELMNGTAVTFWVETQSHPPPSYTWYYATDSILNSTSETFTIPAVSKEHEGMYRCLVANSVTQMSRLGVVKVRVIDSRSPSFSSGAIAGIVIGILVAIALVAGLGYFLYRKRWTRRRSANDTTPETAQPTSTMERSPGSKSNLGCDNPRPVYDNVSEVQRQIGDRKMPPPVLPKQPYKEKPPSAAPYGFQYPQVPKKPLVPPVVPERNMEPSYEVPDLEPETYCTITPSV